MAEPLYRQIAQDLRRKIESGELGPGARLPDYDASRNTIRDAIKWLAIRGLVETRPGQGTFVVRRIEPIVTTLSEDPETGMAGGEGKAAFAEISKRRSQRQEQARQEREKARQEGTEEQAGEPEQDDWPEGEPYASVPTVEVKFAPGYVAERLRIPEGAEVLIRHQEFSMGRTPWSLQTTFYPIELMSRGNGAPALMRARDIEEGTVEYLGKTLGLIQCGYRVRILVRPPNENEARFFGLPDDGRVPVVSLIRTGYEETAEGVYPFRVTITVLPADRHQFVMNYGKVPEELAAPARDQ
ncbi:GntR family transcriptional regulator [Trebonia sp.]|uniref:GntR family transcriptional regulator n=1 Tax=Trebonia sp. TaxID=2767075 RepID=UPI00260A8D0A|nr:GntR family transcriptional regulator [Trebonia sp.]